MKLLRALLFLILDVALGLHVSACARLLHTHAAFPSPPRPPQMKEPLARSSRLNRQAFNRRNMSIDERLAYDEIMREREAAAGSRNAVLAVVLAAAAAAFVLSDPQRLAGLLPGA